MQRVKRYRIQEHVKPLRSNRSNLRLRDTDGRTEEYSIAVTGQGDTGDEAFSKAVDLLRAFNVDTEGIKYTPSASLFKGPIFVTIRCKV